MAERVSTGGTMSFEYKKGHDPKLDKEQKKEIGQAYEQYYDRKRREKKRRNLLIAVAVIVVLIIVFFAVF